MSLAAERLLLLVRDRLALDRDVGPAGRHGHEILEVPDFEAEIRARSVPAEVIRRCAAVRSAVSSARMERAAKVLATLNHPNIAAFYGLEKVEGKAVLVLELVEGPTLAERIAQLDCGGDGFFEHHALLALDYRLSIAWMAAASSTQPSG